MSETEEKKKKTLKSFLTSLVIFIVLAAIAAAGYFYMQNQKTQQLLQNPTLAANQQTQALLAQVGKLIELPKDETPTIATVSDVSKLQGQPFFAKAKNGDKVLIYTKNKKAILYDPAANIIVDVAPVNIGEPTPSPVVSPTVAKKSTVKPTTKPTATPTSAK